MPSNVTNRKGQGEAAWPLKKIISGGQTGADRAALDFAIAHGVLHGGWCPRGRFAEDGTIASRYQLQQTTESSYAQRTEWNVRDSDGTVVFSIARDVTGGSKLTCELAKRHAKPCLHVCSAKDGVEGAAKKLREFVIANNIRTLNVAGPRSSTERTIGRFVHAVLAAVFTGRNPNNAV